MTKNELNREYFRWMCQLVEDKRHRWESYKVLLNHLHNIDYSYDIPMDGNRAEDGIDLRYQFALEAGVDRRIVAAYLDDRNCTVLEMLVALAQRCEVQIMGEPGSYQIGRWFWGMLQNLGLGGMRNERFDIDVVDMVVDKFMRRAYDRNGRGGLFTIEGCREDLRNVEVWYQLNWYLNDILSKTKGESQW